MEKLSKEKNQDMCAYFDMLEIVESAIRKYQNHPTEKLIEKIVEVRDSCERLKTKLETHDYTPDDERRMRVEKRLKLRK